MAKKLCIKYDLLSPIYEFAPRGGCWFCPNMRYQEKKNLRYKHKELWNKLLELEDMPNTIGNKWNILTGETIHNAEYEFDIEDRQMTIFDLDKEG